MTKKIRIWRFFKMKQARHVPRPAGGNSCSATCWLFVNAIDNYLGASITLDGGSVSVNYYDGGLDNLGGKMAPGDDILGNLPGRTVFAGDYFQYSNAALAMDIHVAAPLDGFDVLEVGGYQWRRSG